VLRDLGCLWQGLTHMAEPDPKWRNEADCGLATFNRSDGSTVNLNCAGGRSWPGWLGWESSAAVP
jgi:hypothetical protein